MINILTEGAYLDHEITEDIEPCGIIFNYQFLKYSLAPFLVIIFFTGMRSFKIYFLNKFQMYI